ncbi:MarR family transcriptional regulator [Chelativorans sp. ZYF759]|uniref:MarR family winged helix-turn-helix transcriptional regulator n=1 Tax=Chelativorans sp. ZYF759 TaxID=2692213 RepID=UPI00145D26CC|nr:MarR family transcriptional regulator [Chelativorans sp. ZYF759]NMG38915.1 MarR family transcriptional regulator [Chelativorans sp. ZYF759]
MSSSPKPAAAPSLRANLGWALATLLRAYQKQVEEALAGLPGGARAFLVMSLVERETCHSQIAIAARLGLDKTTLTYLIDGLEKDGLVKRSPDPQDRRSRHINLTAKGQKALSRFANAVDEVEQHLLSRLGASEAAQFRHLLVTAAGLEHPSDASADEEDDVHICKVTLGANETL